MLCYYYYDAVILWCCEAMVVMMWSYDGYMILCNRWLHLGNAASHNMIQPNAMNSVGIQRWSHELQTAGNKYSPQLFCAISKRPNAEAKKVDSDKIMFCIKREAGRLVTNPF